MTKMILVLVVAAVACTKPNPNRCCIDEADCKANDIPVGSTCADGLLCRGNQCVAETCMSAAECDSSAPYCAMGTCAMSCTDDTQCPGSGQDAGDLYCVSGACVACRVGMNDCPASAPVCDMNSCRTCALDSECASNVCDLDNGMCIDTASVLYAAPTGTDSNDCSISAPCTVQKAVTLSDPQHAWVRMLPGSYATTSLGNIVNTAFTLVGTGAVWPNTFPVYTGSTVTIRGLSGVESTCNSTSTPASISLIGVTGSSTAAQDLYGNCNVHISQSKLPSGLTLTYTPSFTIDRTIVMEHFGSVTAANAGLQARITNSVFIDAFFEPDFNTPVAGNIVKMDIAYNTFYSDKGSQPVTCSLNVPPTSVKFTDNIFYAPGASVAVYYSASLNNGCSLETNVEYPQASPLGDNPIVSDPMLVNAAMGDFHLQASSPAKDAAFLTGTDPTVDFDGTTRPQGAGYDIGAFEYH